MRVRIEILRQKNTELLEYSRRIREYAEKSDYATFAIRVQSEETSGISVVYQLRINKVTQATLDIEVIIRNNIWWVVTPQ